MKAPVKFDEYYLVERVAVGGMAEVFKGVSYGAEGFERVSAVKRVLPHVAEDKDFIEMFIDEAQIAAQLQHPNIGQVYHLGQRDGRYFIAMEFISGQDLRAIFDRARELQQPLDLAWCAYIIREVCGALEYAHLKRDSQQRPMHLIHRDVSPQNILVGYDGGVKLIDFGIAKASNKINKTQVGILKGKFSYMSPEQARGHQLDPRTDLFALAIVLYELITLERCFLGQTDFSTIERVRNIEYSPPRKIRRDIPAALEKIVQKGLSRDPNDRYQSASDFQEALTKFLQRHAPRFTRAQGHQYIQRLFRAEIEAEQRRFDEFRRYATEHIPEASRGAAAAGRGRFDPQLSAPRDDSKARYSLDQPRLSINPSLERPRPLSGATRSPHRVSAPSPGARLLLLLTLAGLAAAGAALFVQLRAPQLGALRVNTRTHTPTRFTLEGVGQTREGLAPVLISDLPSGEYRLTLTAQGYPELTSEVRVEAQQITQLSPRREPLTGVGFYHVLTQPPGAEVRLDGRLVGVSPFTLIGSLGPHALTVQAEGYASLTSEVLLSDPPLEPEVKILFPQRVRVHLLPSSPSAQVYLKESPAQERWRLVGRGEQTLMLENLGVALVKVSLKGYASQELPLPRYPEPEVSEYVELGESAEGEPSASDAQLQELSPRALEPKVQPSPEREATSVEPPKKRRAPRHKIHYRSPAQRRSGSARKTSSSVRPRRSSPPPAPKEVESSPKERQPGFLKLITVPPVEVFHQGRSLGWTPLNDYKLLEGHYQLTLRLPNGETHTISQSIMPGRSVLRRWVKP